jgi:hypothetical protein
VVLACTLLTGGQVAAQVYKCVDAAGRTTYQQQPCPAAQKGGRLDIPTSNGQVRDSADREAEWSAAAASRSIVPGMPKRHVRAALGDPTGMRSAKASENAAEIWTYRRPGEATLIGFVNDAMVWQRIEAAPESVLEAVVPPNRREVASLGRDCGDVLQILGSPASIEDAPPRPPAEGEPPVPAKRHYYDPAPGNEEPLVITCAGARVVAVDTAPRR